MFCGSFSLCNVSQNKRSTKAQHSMFHLEIFERQIYLCAVFVSSVFFWNFIGECIKIAWSASLPQSIPA